MTASRKVFLALVLVSAGFGIGKLLGEPDARVVSALRSKSPFGEPATSLPDATPLGNARLVPDFAAIAEKDAENEPAEAWAPGLLDNADPPTARPLPRSAEPIGTLAPDLPAPPEVADPEELPAEHLRPRARLRLEAPRAIVDAHAAPRARSNAGTSSHVFPMPNEHEASTPGDSVAWQAPESSVQQSVFLQADSVTAPIAASYSEITPLPPIDPLASMNPEPGVPEPTGQRVHVIVDGDTLARLAGRYLDDPRRSGEIFEANRAVLADPELLPIGAELVIPDKRAVARSAPGPQSRVFDGTSSHVAQSELVPIRPYQTQQPAPRAQLLPPLPAR